MAGTVAAFGEVVLVVLVMMVAIVVKVLANRSYTARNFISWIWQDLSDK